MRDIVDAERAQSAALQKEASTLKAESDQLEAIVELINNQPPTISDKVFSLGFYLLPLLGEGCALPPFTILALLSSFHSFPSPFSPLVTPSPSLYSLP